MNYTENWLFTAAVFEECCHDGGGGRSGKQNGYDGSLANDKEKSERGRTNESKCD